MYLFRYNSSDRLLKYGIVNIYIYVGIYENTRLKRKKVPKGTIFTDFDHLTIDNIWLDQLLLFVSDF